MIFWARATRGLRRMERQRPGAILARRAPTMKRWSLDARNGDHTSRLAGPENRDILPFLIASSACRVIRLSLPASGSKGNHSNAQVPSL